MSVQRRQWGFIAILRNQEKWREKRYFCSVLFSKLECSFKTIFKAHSSLELPFLDRMPEPWVSCLQEHKGRKKIEILMSSVQ